MKRFPAWLVAVSVLLVTGLSTLLAVPLLRDSLHYQRLTMMVGNDMQLDFFKHGITDAAVCKARLESFVETMKKSCPTCRITTSSCTTRTTPELLLTLSSAALDTPSTRLPDGVVVYRSTIPGVADASCKEGERQAASAPSGARARCFAAGVRRPVDH